MERIVLLFSNVGSPKFFKCFTGRGLRTGYFLLVLISMFLLPKFTSAQAPAIECTGSLGDPVFLETFGAAASAAKPSLGPALPSGLTTYTYYTPGLNGNSIGPYPGQYVISNTTQGYNNFYFVDRPDHSSTDGTGYCMVVDANATPGKFYERTITGLCAGTTFEFSAWLMNINASNNVARPSLRFDIMDANNPNGTPIASVQTGEVAYQAPGTWVRLAGIFQMPATTNAIILRIFSNTPNSNGNDLALDDIAFAACGPPITFSQSAGVVCKGQNSSFTVSLPLNSYNNYYFQLQRRLLNTETWQDVGPVINNGANNEYTFSITNAEAGYEYRAVAAGGTDEINNLNCRVTSDPQELKVIDYSIDVIANGHLCFNGSTNVNATIVPTAGTGTPTTGFTYTWESSATGNAPWTVIAGQTGATLPTGPLTNTMYYRAKASVNGCESNGYSNLTVVQVEPELLVGIDSVNDICQGTTVAQLGYSATSNTPTNYYLSGDMPGFAPVSNGQLPSSPLNIIVPADVPAGTYNFEIIFLTNTDCSITIPFTVTVDAPPTTSVAGPEQDLCGTTSTVMAANTPVVGAGTWSQLSGPSNASIIAENDPATAINGLVPGDYVFQWSISNGSCAASTSTVPVKVVASPTIATAGPDQTQYNSGVFQLAANSPAVGVGMWTAISGDVTFSNANSYNSTATIAPNTSATLVWTITNDICPPSADTVVITYTSEADIVVTKSSQQAGPYIAGQDLNYLLTIKNNGPSTANGVIITDTLPTGYVVSSTQVLALYNAIIESDNSSGNVVSIVATIPANISGVQVLVKGTIGSSFEGDLINIVNAVSPDVPDPDGASDTLILPVTRRPYYEIVKDAPTSAVAGEQIQFQIQVQNIGLGDALQSVITDQISPKLSNVSWTTAPGAGTTLTQGATGSGNSIKIVGDFPAGGNLDITVTGTVNPDAVDTILNSAIITPAETTVPPINSNYTNTLITSSPGIIINKSRTSSTIATAGDIVNYELTVYNNGPSDAVGTNILDTIPAGISNIEWTTEARGTASITSGNTGSGSLVNVTGNIPAGSSNQLIVRVTGTIDPGYSGVLLNTAYAIPAEPNVPPDSDLDIAEVIRKPVFEIQKNGPATAYAGEQVSYVVEVKNTGLSNAVGAEISDLVPASLTDVTWTASAITGAVTINSGATGSSNSVLVNADIAAGASMRIVITGTIIPATTGQIINSADVDPSEIGANDMTSNEVITTVAAQSRLTINKSGPDTASAGVAVTYTLEVKNAGPSSAKDFEIRDQVPASIGNVTWSTSTSGDALISSGSSGSGNDISIVGSMTPGDTNVITVTVMGTILPSFSGDITNTAFVTAPNGNSVGDTATKITRVSKIPVLRINKVAVDQALAGDSIIYAILVNNISTANADSLVISDIVPSSIKNVQWRAATLGNATIIGDSTGSGNNINLMASIPAGSSGAIIQGTNAIILGIRGIVDPGYQGNLSNTATATPSESGADPVSDTKIVNVRRIPNLSVQKSGPASLSAGDPIIYTVSVTNNSKSDADSVAIQDLVPPGVEQVTWTASAMGTATLHSGLTGNGNNINVSASIPGGDLNNKIVITINGIVNASFNGSFQNTAVAIPSEPGVAPSTSDPVITTVARQPELEIKKVGPLTINAGEDVSYLVTVTNTSASDAIDAVITDIIPAVVTNIKWTAKSTGNASISSDSSGTTNNIRLVASIPADTGNIEITVNGKVAANTNLTTMTNRAMVSPAEAGTSSKVDSVVTAITKKPGLKITKIGPSALFAGNEIQYTIGVINIGPSNATGANIIDTVPSMIENVTWTAVTSGNATITSGASGTGSLIDIIGDLPAGAANGITVYVSGTVNGTASGDITNTAYALPSEPGNDPAQSSVTTSLSKLAAVNISKSGPNLVAAGNPIQYVINVLNAGPSAANNITVKDAIPPDIINVTWTATTNGGAVINSGNTGTGDILLNADIPASTAANIEITIDGIVDPNFTGDIIHNTAIVVNDPSVEPVGGDTATVNTAVAHVANLKISKSGPANKGAGEPVEYILRITNEGPMNVKGALIEDILPVQILNATWTAQATGGVTNVSPMSNAGNVSITADLPANDGALEVTISGIMSPALVSGSTVINTATVKLPAGSNIIDPFQNDNTATVNTLVDNDPVIRIAKTGPSIADVGDTIHYTVYINNGGAGFITGASFEDIVPASVDVYSWTAVGVGAGEITGATSGNTNNVTTTGNINGTAFTDGFKIDIYGVINQSAGTSIVNTASVVAGANKQSSVITSVNNSTDVNIVKAGPQSVNAGEKITYSFVVRNDGPRDVDSLIITDNIPAEIMNVTWTAIATGNASTLDSNRVDSSGNIINFPAKIAAGDDNYITVEVQGTVDGNAAEGTITNSANATVFLVNDYNTTNNTSEVTTDIGTDIGLIVRKHGPASAIAGNTINYQIVITNSGASNVSNALIEDQVPTEIQDVSWSVQVYGGASINGAFSGSGNAISTSANIPGGAGNGIIITIQGTIDPNFDGTIVNGVNVSGTGFPTVSDDVSTVVTKSANINLKKSGPDDIVAGAKINYVITATNLGPSFAQGVTITDTIDSRIENVSWVATATNGAVINSGNNGTGNQISVNADIPPDESAMVMINVSGTVKADATGTISNSATAETPGTVDPPIITPPIITPVEQHPQLDIIKSGPANAAAGAAIQYSLQVRNIGLSNAVHAIVTDVIPSQISNVSWSTTSITNGVVINSGATGSGNDLQIDADIPQGAGFIVNINGTIADTYKGTVMNTATVVPSETGGTADTSKVTTNVSLQPGLQINKEGPSLAIAGSSITYTITATNNGPSAAMAAMITDQVPPGIGQVSWTAEAMGNANILSGATGTGNYVSLSADIPPGNGNGVKVTITGTVYPSTRDSLENIAVITPSEVGIPADTSSLVTTSVNALPRFEVVKVGPANAVAGDTIKYNITVRNSGASDAIHAMISDAVPGSIQQVSWMATATGAAIIHGANTGTGNAINIDASIPTGAANQIQVSILGVIDAAASGTIVNTANVTPSEPGVNSVNAAASTLINNTSNISITKTGPVTMQRGDQESYTLDIHNFGPSNAVGTIITDTIPGVLENVTWTAKTINGATISSGATGTGNIIYIIADMPAMNSGGIHVDISGTVRKDAQSGTVTNTAYALANNNNLFASNTVSSNIIAEVDLRISKSAPSNIYVGNDIYYQVVAQNLGPSDAGGALITDVFPQALTAGSFVSVVTAGGAGDVQTAVNGNTVTAVIGQFPAGSRVTFTAKATTVVPGTLVNTVNIITPNGLPDKDSANNSSQVTTRVLPKNVLDIDKSVDPGTGPYYIGQQITYTLTATNEGAAGVNPVIIVDTLPPGNIVSEATYQSPPRGTVSYTENPNVLVWNLGLLSAGETLSWSYQVTVQDTGTVRNLAIISGPPDVSTGDTTELVIKTDKYANLKVVKQATTPQPLSVGNNIDFLITATNNGPDTATNVIVQDILASMLSRPLSMMATLGQVDFDISTNAVIWQIPLLPPGASATANISVRLINGEQVTNTVTISGKEIDIDLSDNTYTIQPIPITGDDLFIPNVITPNGDGKNDVFYIPGLSKYPGSQLYIYNRWGNQVYQSKDYDNQWNGNGLNEGTYFYILKLNTESGFVDHKGWIELLR